MVDKAVDTQETPRPTRTVGEVLMERVQATLAALENGPRHEALENAYQGLREACLKVTGRPQRPTGDYKTVNKGEVEPIVVPAQAPMDLDDDWDDDHLQGVPASRLPKERSKDAVVPVARG